MEGGRGGKASLGKAYEDFKKSRIVIKRIFSGILIVSLFGSCSPIQMLPLGKDNKKFNQYKLVKEDKLKNGRWVECEDGNIVIGNYKMGLQAGKFFVYYKAGGYKVSHFKRGVLEGIESYYNENGVLYTRTLYKNGKVVNTFNNQFSFD